jgi:hypothetical protein
MPSVGDTVYCNALGEAYWDNRSDGEQLYWEGDCGVILSTSQNRHGETVHRVQWERRGNNLGDRWWINEDGLDIYTPIRDTDRIALEALVEVLKDG